MTTQTDTAGGAIPPRRGTRNATAEDGPRTFTVILPLPPEALWPNARVFHYAKAAQAKKYRTVSYSKARAAWGQQVAMLRADIVVIVTFCQQRSRDGDNCLAALKAGIDGIVDAGVLKTDSRRYVASTTVRVDRHKHRPGAPCAGSEVRVDISEVMA